MSSSPASSSAASGAPQPTPTSTTESASPANKKPVVEELSGVAVVIIIAIGVQGCIMLFIFAKRQIMRFALRTRRGPHTHIGQGGPKFLRREIDRLLEYVPYVKLEPTQLNYIKHEPSLDGTASSGVGPGSSASGNSTATTVEQQIPSHYYRIKAVQQLRLFERDISSYNATYSRIPGASVRTFLLSCLNGPLGGGGVDARDVHRVCDGYEAARHHYEAFDEGKLELYSSRLASLREALLRNKWSKPQPSPLAARSAGGTPKRRGGGKRSGGGGSSKADAAAAAAAARGNRGRGGEISAASAALLDGGSQTCQTTVLMNADSGGRSNGGDGRRSKEITPV